MSIEENGCCLSERPDRQRKEVVGIIYVPLSDYLLN